MEGKKSKFVFLNSGHFFILKTMALAPCSYLAVPFSSLHFYFFHLFHLVLFGVGSCLRSPTWNFYVTLIKVQAYLTSKTIWARRGGSFPLCMLNFSCLFFHPLIAHVGWRVDCSLEVELLLVCYYMDVGWVGFTVKGLLSLPLFYEILSWRQGTR